MKQHAEDLLCLILRGMALSTTGVGNRSCHAIVVEHIPVLLVKFRCINSNLRIMCKHDNKN